MGRKAATIEYLERLVEWAGGPGPLCAASGILRPNLNAYRLGSKPISWKRLRAATKSVFGQPPAFKAIAEGHAVTTSADRGALLARLPESAGLYGLFDSAMRLIYFGKATSLRAEVRQTLGRHVAEVRPWTGGKNLEFADVTAYVSAYEIVRGDAEFRHDVEALGLRLFVNNTFNKNGAKFKRDA